LVSALKKKIFETSISTLKYSILAVSIFSSVFLAIIFGYQNYLPSGLQQHNSVTVQNNYKIYQSSDKNAPVRKSSENYLNGSSEEEFQVKYAPKFVLKNSAINPGYLSVTIFTVVSILTVLIISTHKQLFLLRSPPA